MKPATSVLLDGLAFPEGPRWREGKLWFSDMHDDRVMTVDLEGRSETVVEVPGRPSGLGWLPDGHLLVVSMTDRRLLRLDPGGLTQVADLSALASFHCNDMVADVHGRAYVGNFGYDVHGGAPVKNAALVLVAPGGEARVVADDLRFPNGMVITPDGRTLVVGETLGQRLTAFDIEDDGSLGGRRVWAQLERVLPDGICLDAEGGIWVATVVGGEVLRVLEGGEVTHRLPVATQAFACMLGGPKRCTLFVCTAETSEPEKARANPTGRIEIAEVEVPGVGLP
jgi:sugar lactone lactonase YvrE